MDLTPRFKRGAILLGLLIAVFVVWDRMTTEVHFGHGWEALTNGVNALQSSELFRREASAQLNQEAYYGPAGDQHKATC